MLTSRPLLYTPGLLKAAHEEIAHGDVRVRGIAQHLLQTLQQRRVCGAVENVHIRTDMVKTLGKPSHFFPMPHSPVGRGAASYLYDCQAVQKDGVTHDGQQ